MGFEEALEYLESLGVDAMKSAQPTLSRMQALMEALDHPERAVPTLHVTGTNGKTSTARIAASLLAGTGLPVGTYTSPHLQTVRERIALSGQPISAADFGDVFQYVQPYVELVEKEIDERLTYFEVLTAMYFVWAADSVNVSVVEVGLGGRWDATNVVDSRVAVITNVGLDHTGLLGTTHDKIAREKAGIIKPGSAVVTAERRPDVLQVIREEAKAKKSLVSRLDRDFEITEDRLAVGGRYISVRTSSQLFDGLFLPLLGRHQATNAATALEAVTRFLPPRSLEEDVVAEGLGAARVPGRLETVTDNDSPSAVVLDVAHNPDGMSALVKSLVESFVFSHAVFVLGVLADKDYRGMLLELTRLDCEVIATEAKSVRSVPAPDLARAAQDVGLHATTAESVTEAVKTAISRVGDNGLACVTGSHYVVGEARSTLAGQPLP